MTRRFHVAAAFVLAATFAVCGCSSPNADGIDRVAVSGKVTLDGEPVASGYVTFTPLGNGPSAGGEIRDGSYDIDTASGPSAGKYKVEIRSSAPTGRKVPNYDGAPGETVDETYEQIPPNYNSRSELSVEIKAGESNSHDFALTGKLPVPSPGATKKAGARR